MPSVHEEGPLGTSPHWPESDERAARAGRNAIGYAAADRPLGVARARRRAQCDACWHEPSECACRHVQDLDTSAATAC